MAYSMSHLNIGLIVGNRYEFIAIIFGWFKILQITMSEVFSLIFKWLNRAVLKLLRIDYK